MPRSRASGKSGETSAAEFGVPFEVDAPPEVEQYQRPAVVHRQCEAVAADARLRPQGAVDGLAQHDRHVFHRVVFVDVQVAVRLHRERHPAVVGDLGQHVIQEPQPGGNPVARGGPAGAEAPAVEVYAYGDLRFARFARHNDPPFPAADVFRDLGPRVRDERACLFRARFPQHPASFGGRRQKDALRPEVARQQDVGRPVADDVARPEVVRPVRVAAEHARTGFARRGIVAFERAVDEHVVERDAFACERAQHFFVRRPEILLREGLRAQPVLVRRHHQLEIQPPERPERRDRTGYEFQLFEAVDLVIRGRLRDHGAVAVYEERFFHGRKFLTVSNMRSFSSGRPTVMRRQPSQPAIRERLRTMTPAATSSRYNGSGAAVFTSRKLPSDG